MSWNVNRDGRITRLDNGPKRPWWWKDEPQDDTSGGSGIRTSLRNASDTHREATTTHVDRDPAAGRR
jgi:hypothetical protein